MRETTLYNILCATDDNYVPYCGIMLTSLFENNKELNLCIYILAEHLSDKSKNEFATLARNYSQKIEIITVNNDILKDCPIRIEDHVSIATYYRLLAPVLLPSDIDKILYLDCDIIINGDISSLYKENIDGLPIAMSKDEAFFSEEKYKRLNYNKSNTYKNAGVALINIKYWRDNNITEKCLEYISKYPKRIKFHDQDTLNAVLHKEMKLLPIKYNLQTGFLLTHYTQYYKNELEEIIAAANSPIIIHFTGASKPWYKGSRHPFCNLFLYYKSISLWKDEPLKRCKQSLHSHLIELRNKLIWILGIKKRPQSYIINKYQRL